MKIRFEITVDDVIACRRFDFFRSNARLMVLWPTHIVYVSLLSGSFILAAFHFGDRVPGQLHLLGVAICVVILIVGGYLIQPTVSLILAWRTRRSLHGREAHRLLGWREMDLDDWPLAVRTGLTFYRLDLRAISSIVVQHRHAFLCVDSGDTMIIPLYGFHEKECRSFLADLRYSWENRDSGPPTVWRKKRLLAPFHEHVQELSRFELLVAKEELHENPF